MVINDVAKQFMQYRIESCDITASAISEEITHTMSITCVNQGDIQKYLLYKQYINHIGTNSYLFIHVRWLTIRVSVVSITSISPNDSPVTTITLTTYGQIPRDVLGYINADDIMLDIVNPEISTSAIANEYYIFDGSDILYKSNDTLSSQSVKIAGQGELVSIENSSHLKFSNICFRNNGVTNITHMSFIQAEALSIPCVYIYNSQHILFENCSFHGIMGYCLYIKNCSNVEFRNCYIHDSFGGGFYIEESQYCTIQNCLIKNYGLAQQGAVGILIMRSSYCNITHNTIHDGFYTGISVGWTWGYDSNTCHHNIISYNHIHHCMKMVSNDGGGIYTLGISEGTIIEHNVIHDIISRRANDSSAIYMDEGTSFIKCRYNICYGCDRAFHLHYGYANEIYCNFFAFCNNMLFKYSASERTYSQTKTLAFYAHDNILNVDSGGFILSTPNKGVYLFSHNLLDDSTHMQDLSDKIRLQDFHFGPISAFVGDNKLLHFTKHGIKRSPGTLAALSLHNFPIFNASEGSCQNLNVLTDPSLCGVPSDMKQDYDSDSSNETNFENQRQKVIELFSSQYSHTYFDEPSTF